jgi:hypothetical protein
MDQQQLMPRHVGATNIKATNNMDMQTDLSNYFWLALVVVFMIERLLAHRNKREPKNG